MKVCRSHTSRGRGNLLTTGPSSGSRTVLPTTQIAYHTAPVTQTVPLLNTLRKPPVSPTNQAWGVTSGVCEETR